MAMTPKNYLARRNRYSYPTVGLRRYPGGYKHRTFPSIATMERTLRKFLMSPSAADVQLGYLSVVYWGHYSGKAGIAQPGRAMSKVDLALAGLTRLRFRPLAVAITVRSAHRLIRLKRCGDAVWGLTALPQLGFAFASKVCAFLSPGRCGVIDSVIAGRYKRFGFAMTKSGKKYYVATKASNKATYSTYCRFLAREASRLNTYGRPLRWVDRDGRKYAWRAVDVERALY